MRFYEYYNVDEAMTELPEAEARSRDTYAEQHEAPLLHYRIIFDGTLERVVYPGFSPDQEIVRFHSAHYGQVPFWIVSPVERSEAGTHYDTWYYESASTRPTRVHYDNGKTQILETFYDEDGRLAGSNERRFHEWGEHIETISRDASGRIVSIDD